MAFRRQSYGAKGHRLEKAADLPALLKKCLTEPAVHLLEIPISCAHLKLPPGATASATGPSACLPPLPPSPSYAPWMPSAWRSHFVCAPQLRLLRPRAQRRAEESRRRSPCGGGQLDGEGWLATGEASSQVRRRQAKGRLFPPFPARFGVIRGSQSEARLTGQAVPLTLPANWTTSCQQLRVELGATTADARSLSPYEHLKDG